MIGEIERYWKVMEKQTIRGHREALRRSIDELRIKKYEAYDTDRDGKADSSTESDHSDWDGSSSDLEAFDDSDFSGRESDSRSISPEQL